VRGVDLGLELLHHKLYLEDPPDEIESFSVSHGLNLLTLDGAWPLGPVRIRAGGGLVIAHPEGSIRGVRIDESAGIGSAGYHLTGPVIRGGVVVARELAAHLSVVIEGRATAARVRVPVAGGHAAFPSLGVHLLAGVRFHRSGPGAWDSLGSGRTLNRGGSR